MFHFIISFIQYTINLWEITNEIYLLFALLIHQICF